VAGTNDRVQREILPILDIPPVGLTAYDAKDSDSAYPPIAPLHAPAGPPNVLVILLGVIG
jgi:arylsulfatase